MKQRALTLVSSEAIGPKSRNPAELKEDFSRLAPSRQQLLKTATQSMWKYRTKAREMGFAGHRRFGVLVRYATRSFCGRDRTFVATSQTFVRLLHQYVRLKLQQTYGKAEVPDNGPIPAHLFGNMWSQSWENLYPIVKPQGPAANLDIAETLKAKISTPKPRTKMSEGFYTSARHGELCSIVLRTLTTDQTT